MNIPTFSKNTDPVLRKLDRFIEWFMLTLILCVTLLVCCSCGSTKVVTQTVRDVTVDTVYLSNIQYDSIYIYQDHVSEHHIGKMEPVTNLEKDILIPIRTDTLYIKDKSIEYRYKMLRDTIYKTQVDSIPYQVTITEVKEIQRPLTWYDHLSRAILWLNIGFVLLLFVRFIRKLKALGS